MNYSYDEIFINPDIEDDCSQEWNDEYSFCPEYKCYQEEWN